MNAGAELEIIHVGMDLHVTNQIVMNVIIGSACHKRAVYLSGQPVG